MASVQRQKLPSVLIIQYMYIPNHSDFAFIPEQYCNNLKLCLIDKMADNH